MAWSDLLMLRLLHVRAHVRGSDIESWEKVALVVITRTHLRHSSRRGVLSPGKD
jgi:hypothetical protein